LRLGVARHVDEDEFGVGSKVHDRDGRDRRPGGFRVPSDFIESRRS
jgi:hypothetical protein